MESLFRFRVLLEPRGFLRIIEFFLAVLMFATTAGYSSSVVYNITCLNYEFEKKYEFGYPFNFKDYDEVCVPSNATGGMKVNAYPGGKASFFVAIGVLAMLYCIATLIWYVIFEVKFIRFDLIPAADLVLTATFALFFFLASCAWASGVSTVKYWTTFENIKTNFYKNVCNTPGTKCIGVTPASYASLNASILFGFLNFLVWLGNCWFVFKETTWFQARQKKQEPQTQAEPPPNDI
ncbi:synaptophysin-like isoform X2 [Acanthaster planci]|uniref:Synaptophysin-like isoform X2 n=1 Tax=Acanthaster planci TaxID=133434 RepID=A0A8B7XLS0_ACAPL|nr:synaptophysin-like isoform X2 [Acanthaster planci]